jgi:hypothetical protein
MKEGKDNNITTFLVEERYSEDNFDVIYYYLEDEDLWLHNKLRKLGIIDFFDEYTSVYLSEEGYFLSEVINNKKEIIGLSIFLDFKNYVIDYYLQQKEISFNITPIIQGFFQNSQFKRINYVEFSYEILYKRLCNIPQLLKNISGKKYIELPSNECIIEYGLDTYWLMDKDDYLTNYKVLFPPNDIKQEAIWIGMNIWGNDFLNKKEEILSDFSHILSIPFDELFTFIGIDKVDKQIAVKLNAFEMYYKLFPMLYLYILSHLDEDDLVSSLKYIDSINSWVPTAKYGENQLRIENYIGEYLGEILNDFDDRQPLIGLIVELQELVKG